MIGYSASHATERRNVIPRELVEEVCGRFISNGRFKELLLTTQGEPLLSFERSTSSKNAPVKGHLFGVVTDEIGDEYPGRDYWRDGGA
jgi:hypothetical protein